jgi:hypothetical protein
MLRPAAGVVMPFVDLTTEGFLLRDRRSGERESAHPPRSPGSLDPDSHAQAELRAKP